MCGQPATLTVYLDDEPVHQSDPGVQQVSHTFPSAPRGEHMVRVTATNENGTGENYWIWNVRDTIHLLRQFEASSDQTAVTKMYVNGFLVAESTVQPGTRGTL
ncbi:hypothetical protein MBOURGENBZM_22650 [Methanoculleus bourgensis]|nr:hypothetical protein MBOURGENBZM_22650 [Methanoculleus bourgensis]